MSSVFKKLGYDEYFLNLLTQTTEPVEIEVRFGEVSFARYKRVSDYLYSKYGPPEETNSDDSKLGDVRQSVYNLPDGSTKYINITKKILGERFDTDGIGIKIVASTETEVPTNEPFLNPDITRNKDRKSWILPDKNIRFDITRVTQTIKNKPTETKFEVEIELLHPLLESRKLPLSSAEEISFKNAILNSLGLNTLIIKGRLQGTDINYLISTQKELANFINTSVNGAQYLNQYESMPTNGDLVNFTVQARNIDLKDMVYHGLLNKLPGTTYSVTVKAEGLRKFLVIHTTGIWLVFPGSGRDSEFCKIMNATDMPPSWKEFNGTILDGEDIPQGSHRKNYENALHYYLPFDTLVFKGKDVTSEPLEKRLQYTRFIRGLGGIMEKGRVVLVMEEKPFYFFSDTAEEFYKAIEKIERFVPSYETDGLIFTPNNTVYNPQSDKIRGERTLKRAPDICKWKPFDKQSIDLAYYLSGSKRFLSAGNAKKEFTGSDDFPFDSETQVDWHSPFFKEWVNGSILEFAPKLDSDGNIMMVPIRQRTDKAFPNSERTARDVWKHINLPIPIETLRGESMDLVRRYHNSIKRNLLFSVEEGAHLIDIGSGRGGDLGKMDKFGKILCIEPSEENLFGKKGLMERLQTSRNKDKVSVLQCGGEDTTKILKEVKKVFGKDFGKKPVYISMMLSLSFFWKDEAMLKGLCETLLGIKELAGNTEVNFIFLTIEGKRTLKLLEKYDNNIRFGNFFAMERNLETDEIYLDFPNTIVGKQTEYIVQLDELPKLLNANVDYIKDANQERFLNKYEKQFTSMYVYGKYVL